MESINQDKFYYTIIRIVLLMFCIFKYKITKKLLSRLFKMYSTN